MLKNPKTWLTVSLVTFAVGIGIIAVQPPVLGLDFTGGSLIEFTTQENPDLNNIREKITSEVEGDVLVQATQDSSILARTRTLSEDEHQALKQSLIDQGFMAEELRFESIGPTIGASLRQKAMTAIGIAILAMLVYLAYSFRQITGLLSPWKFGVAAVIALIHDLLVVTAAFALLRNFGAAVDSLFITAMLAILGYSVNDTIVLFNRLKEEWVKNKTAPLADVLDLAIKKTLARSLNTSFTTIIVLGTLLFFGGETLRWFILALLIGTVSGTYSSLFVAPPILHLLANTKKK